MYVRKKEMMIFTVQVPAHLATSPIPSAMDLMEAGLVELHRKALEERELLDDVALAMDNLTLDTGDDSRSRSITPTPSIETGVGTQTGTPPMSPKMSKDNSAQSMSSTGLPKKDSQTSLYHSVHTSFDHGSDRESSKEDVRASPSQLKKDSGSDDDRKSDMATQTDMTGDEVLATLTKSSPSISTGRQTSEESVSSTLQSAVSLPSVRVVDESSPSSSLKLKRESSPTGKLGSSPSATPRTKISSAKKKRRKKIEQKRREMQNLKDSTFANVSEAEEADNSSVEGQPGENLMFELDMSSEDTCDELTMSRTVSMPIIDDQRRQMVGEWRSSQHASAFHPFSDGDITPIMR